MAEERKSRYGAYDEPVDTHGVAPNRRAFAGILVAIVAACLGPLLWYGFYRAFNSSIIPPFVIGISIGVALRVVGKSNDQRVSIIAAVLTVLSCFAGYVWTDMALVPWTPPSTFMQAVSHFLGDYLSLLLVAVSTYLAWIIARRGDTPPPQRPQGS